MKIQTGLFLALFSISSFAAATIDYPENTLGANDAFKNTIAESKLNEVQAQALLNAPYTGFYQIKGKAKNNKFSFDNIHDGNSFPDNRYQGLAQGIAGLVKIPAYTTGSHIKPSATAYIMLYEGGIDGLDPKDAMFIPTSKDAEPNTLAVLVVTQKDTSRATRASRTAHKGKGEGIRDGSAVYFFKLAI